MFGTDPDRGVRVPRLRNSAAQKCLSEGVAERIQVIRRATGKNKVPRLESDEIYARCHGGDTDEDVRPCGSDGSDEGQPEPGFAR